MLKNNTWHYLLESSIIFNFGRTAIPRIHYHCASLPCQHSIAEYAEHSEIIQTTRIGPNSSTPENIRIALTNLGDETVVSVSWSLQPMVLGVAIPQGVIDEIGEGELGEFSSGPISSTSTGSELAYQMLGPPFAGGGRYFQIFSVQEDFIEGEGSFSFPSAMMRLGPVYFLGSSYEGFPLLLIRL